MPELKVVKELLIRKEKGHRQINESSICTVCTVLMFYDVTQ